MKFSGVIVLLVAMAASSSAWAKSPKKSEITHIFCPATYAYVKTMDGDVMRPGVLPEDRDAAYRVEDKLSNWNRYVLVYEPQQADLIFVVRAGRLATTQGDMGAAAGSPDRPINAGTPGANRPPRDPSDASQGPAPDQSPATPDARNRKWVGAGGEAGPPDDLLAVYAKPGDVNTQTPLWEQTAKDGLADPNVPLFEQIRTAVDQACHDQPNQPNHDQPRQNNPNQNQPQPQPHP